MGNAALQKELAQRARLGDQRLDPDLGNQLDAAFERHHRQHRRRAGQQAGDARSGFVFVGEGERFRVAHPAGQRLRKIAVVPFGNEGVSGRAGAAVQILVAAAHREVGLRAVQVDRHCTARVREVPQHDRADIVRSPGQRLHVEHFAGLVVDMRQQQQRDVFIQRVHHRVARREPLFDAGVALNHVEVGREIARLAQHDVTVRIERKRRADQLGEVYRDRIARDHLVRLRADQRGNLRAHALRHGDPVATAARQLVPAADQTFAPLGVDHPVQTLTRCLGQRPERIAVEVDHPFGQIEALAKVRDAIGCIEFACPLKHRATPAAPRDTARHRRRRPSAAAR